MDKLYQNTEEHLLSDKEGLFKEKANIIEEILHSKVKWISRKQRQRQS
jgi:hypothetical protein